MRHTNWWLMLLVFVCVVWFVVLPVVQLAIGIINRGRIEQVERRPHITVWTYLTPEDIASLRADGAVPVILKGVAHLDEIDVFAEDTTLAKRGGMMDDSMAYVGRCKGCMRLVMATVDSEEHRRDVAKEVQRAIKDGLTIERMTVEGVRKADFGCECKKGRK